MSIILFVTAGTNRAIIKSDGKMGIGTITPDADSLVHIKNGALKAEDIKIEFTDNKSIRVSNLIYEDDYSYVHLLKNRLVASAAAPAQYLIPELSRFDFLLKVNNQTDDQWAAQVYDMLRGVNTADYVTKIEVEKIKQKENLLF